jgi:hypothetical protein
VSPGLSPASASARACALVARRALKHEVRELQARRKTLEQTLRNMQTELAQVDFAINAATVAARSFALPSVTFAPDRNEHYKISMSTDDVEARATPSPVKRSLMEMRNSVIEARRCSQEAAGAYTVQQVPLTREQQRPLTTAHSTADCSASGLDAPLTLPSSMSMTISRTSYGTTARPRPTSAIADPAAFPSRSYRREKAHKVANNYLGSGLGPGPRVHEPSVFAFSQTVKLEEPTRPRLVGAPAPPASWLRTIG